MHMTVDQVIPPNKAEDLGFDDHLWYPLMITSGLKIPQTSFTRRFKWNHTYVLEGELYPRKEIRYFELVHLVLQEPTNPMLPKSSS